MNKEQSQKKQFLYNNNFDSNNIGISKQIVYPNVDEIPVIEIKDENSFKNGAKIETYLNSLNNIEKYDETKFNKCNNCNHNNNNNEFFCEKCNKNLCFDCSDNCTKNNHELIDLLKKQKSIETKKMDIKKILIKEINEKEIKQDLNINSRTNDILLISRIINKIYINYFHFENISRCYYYLISRYIINPRKNCMKIIYDVKDCKEEEIRIFGRHFVEANKDKLSLIINNEKSELIEKIKNNGKDNDYLEIILIQEDENKYLEDMSCMFCACNFIKSFNTFLDHKPINFSHVKDISYMFKDCSNITTLNLDIFKPFSNVTNMENLFYNCNKLKEINGLQEWNTFNVTSMANMFNGCKELQKINDIEQFKTDNVINFAGMFSNCSSLKSLPNIENWNTEKAENLEGMFKSCKKLEQIPDISKWNLENAITMKKMFSKCVSIKSLPDFSKWDLKNIRNLDKMFYECETLYPKPDINNWKIKSKDKATMSKIFGDDNIQYINF